MPVCTTRNLARALATPITLALMLSAPLHAAAPAPAAGRQAMAVSAHRLATEAGLDVLRKGGNAVDAAVAVGYALAVTFPEAGNIGGGGFMTLRLADGTTRFLDFRETAPARATPTMYLDKAGKVIPGLSTRGYLALAWGIGRVAARSLGRRIAAINAVFGSFGREGAGDRAPVSHRGDEIDALSGHLNTVLDRIALLLVARKELSDAIAHETRSPLMHIGARIARARATGLEAGADQQLDAAQGDIRNLQRMLDTLLDIASSEAQRGEMNSLPEMDLAEVASRLAELYEPTAEDMGITFIARIAPHVPMRGEPVQMSSLIVNLLDNAFKYGADGRIIRLIVEPGPRLVVEDEGTGIPPERREAIFERFTRAHQRGKGHGLGLALVRAIAERHGLAIKVESTIPAGPDAGSQEDHEQAKGARFVVG